MLDCHLTDDYRFNKTYEVSIEDFVCYYQKEWCFKSFSKKYGFDDESNLYGGIVDNLLHNPDLIQWWSDCITDGDRKLVVAEAGLREGVALSEDDISRLKAIVSYHDIRRDIYNDVEELAEERFIERYKRQTGRDYVEVDYLINIYAD